MNGYQYKSQHNCLNPIKIWILIVCLGQADGFNLWPLAQGLDQCDKIKQAAASCGGQLIATTEACRVRLSTMTQLASISSLPSHQPSCFIHVWLSAVRCEQPLFVLLPVKRDGRFLARNPPKPTIETVKHVVVNGLCYSCYSFFHLWLYCNLQCKTWK